MKFISDSFYLIKHTLFGPDPLGPELITNGGFDTDLSGWDQAIAVEWVYDAGTAATNTSAYAPLHQTINFQAGVKYKVVVDVVVNSGTLLCKTMDANGTAVLDDIFGPITASGHYEAEFTASFSKAAIGFYRSGSLNGSIDNVSVRVVL